MLTPAFELRQDDKFLTIEMKTPFIKATEAEIFIENNEFKFYCKPYYLRLTLPGCISEDGRESATYDVDASLFSIKVPKTGPGEHFEGLDMLTKLLAPTGKTSVAEPCIEVLTSSPTGKDDEAESGTEQEENEEEFDWQIDQTPFTDEDRLYKNGSAYGFANKKIGVLKRLQEELKDVLDLPDADGTTSAERQELRQSNELERFSEDQYLCDLYENDDIDAVLAYKTPWLEQYKQVKSGIKPEEVVTFSEAEKNQMRKLPRKEYLLDKKSTQQVFFSLVDILFAYAYNHRTTIGENTVESGWTIHKLSGTLSWLETFTSLKDVAIVSYRRSLCFPLYRHWKISEKVFRDVLRILYIGQRLILKCLLNIQTIFNESEPRYILNELYINDYCVWIQGIKPKQIYSLAKNLADINTTKADVGFDLELLEEAGQLALNEEQSNKQLESSETVDQSGIEAAMNTLSLNNIDVLKR